MTEHNFDAQIKLNNTEDIFEALESCKRIVRRNGDYPPGARFLRSELFVKSVVRDLLFFRSYVRKGSQVLDLGCGCGYISAILSYLGYSCMGIDLPPYLLSAEYKTEEHRELCWQDFQRKYNAEYAYFNGKAIPLAAESIDAVLLYGVLEHIGEDLMKELLTEVRRVLRKGGYLFIFKCPRKLALTERSASALKLPRHDKLLSEKDIVHLLGCFEIERMEATDTLPQHFIEPIQSICNVITPVLYQIQRILDHSPLNIFSHNLRVVAKK